MCLKSFGKFSEAIDYHMKALDIQRKLFGTEEQTDLEMSLNNIGVCLQSLGKYNEAGDYFQKSIDIQRKIYMAQMNILV